LRVQSLGEFSTISKSYTDRWLSLITMSGKSYRMKDRVAKGEKTKAAANP